MSENATLLRLRAPEPEDLDVMMELENGMEPWEVSTSTGPYSRYQLKCFLEESQNVSLYRPPAASDDCSPGERSGGYARSLFIRPPS